jgi:hypothetical protein
MAQSVRISDDLYSMAQNVSLALERPIAQQVEFWARLGMALDAAGVSTEMAMDLLGNGAKVDESVVVPLGHLAIEEDGGLSMLKDRQRKDAEEVAAGLRDPRSLMVVRKGDLKGVRFSPNPASKFSGKGEGW